MPIPEFNEIKAPALQLLSDGNPWKVPAIIGLPNGEPNQRADDLAREFLFYSQIPRIKSQTLPLKGLSTMSRPPHEGCGFSYLRSVPERL